MWKKRYVILWLVIANTNVIKKELGKYMNTRKTSWIGITIYSTENTVPRKLAPENAQVLRDGMAVEDEQSWFCLTPGKALLGSMLWYEKNGEWVQAEWTGTMWQLPGDAMSSRANCRTPLCTAKTRIAFAKKGEWPTEEQKRVLAVHFLKNRKEPCHAES